MFYSQGNLVDEEKKLQNYMKDSKIFTESVIICKLTKSKEKSIQQSNI